MKKKHPGREECLNMLKEYNTPDHVVRHCLAVTDAALKIAGALNDKGYDFDIPLIQAAGLLHDIARIEDMHWLSGADFAFKSGYIEESKIIKNHMTHSSDPDPNKLKELDIVCLGDRLILEDKYVGIDARMDYVIKKAGGDKKTERYINKKREINRLLINNIEEITDISINELIWGDKFEKLLKRVEKPARYIGGEINEVKKDAKKCGLRFGFAFPDKYEIGMSYLGLQIIYQILNMNEKIFCERVFAPELDMEDLMRKEKIPLFTLETKTPVRELDIVGFTLQYELSYTNILNMLSLAGIPFLARDRGESMPLIVGGGPCAFNPEPLAEIFDLFIIGDGEEAALDLCELYLKWKGTGVRWESKESFLKKACAIEGVYVPCFYNPVYDENGEIKEIKKIFAGAADRIKKRVVWDLNSACFPENNIVPLTETVHNRAVVEIFRGCSRGCRFCQAGTIYRPVRERARGTIVSAAMKQLDSTGHEELSLLSLSTGDHTEFEPLVLELMEVCSENNISLSLPSLRLDSLSHKALDEIGRYKKSGLTFAPEAGSARMRDVINKCITEEDILESVNRAAKLGWNTIKLYFMIGLPTETYEDLDGIAHTVRRIMEICRLRRFKLTVSISNFVPKAHTPFQWEAQDSYSEFTKKHDYLKEKLKIKGVTYNYHDSSMSVLEAVFARGDRRLGAALIKAWEKGCKFDGWTEHFDYEKWKQTFEETGIDACFYASRERSYTEILPWEIIDSLIHKEFLISENEKAKAAETTENCIRGCAKCGICIEQ